MSTFHLDFETRSRADLPSVGGWHYARHPSTEILCAAIRRNDEPVLVWSPLDGFGDDGAELLLREMLADDGPIYAHNATGFEVPVSEHVLTRLGFPLITRTRWRCTATMARRANIPPPLEKAAATLKLDSQKDKIGSKLIKLFSIPQKDTGDFTDPYAKSDEFRQFLEYCRKDVLAECALAEALKDFELTGWMLDIFHEDININARGMPVNLDALRKAQVLIDAEAGPAFEEFRQLTGLNPTQNAKLREWFAANGLHLPNLQGQTIEDLLDDDTFDRETPAGKALQLLQNISFASVKKVRSMLDCAGPDDCFIRGVLQFYGAQATGRMSGRLIQPQNFKRPEFDETERAYRHICEGWSKEMLEAFYELPIFSIIASCIRHFIHDPQGPMLSADYSAIEARVIAWLAGEEWRLEVFRTHGQIYEAAACQMFGMTMQQFKEYRTQNNGKHHPMRAKGKVSELACIAEGQMVLVSWPNRPATDFMHIPIEQVEEGHTVWDGNSFVTHSGVVWQGYKPVWEYCGLQATGDHVVFTKAGEMTFKQAMDRREPLVYVAYPDTGRMCPGSPRYVGWKPVYDILNCGPLNRFTVSGVLVHNCGYQGGVGALEKMGALDMGLSQEELLPLVRQWRAANPNIVRLWHDCEDTARTAIACPGRWFTVGRAAFGVFASAGARYLFIRLPSGRRLAYRDPKIESVKVPRRKDAPKDTPDEYREQITHFGPASTAGGARSALWGRATLYGGKIVENITQAVAFDIMANGTLNAARRGYRIYSLIHDEAMSAFDNPNTQSIEEFQACLEDPPAWADGLPLGTSGEVIPFYKK